MRSQVSGASPTSEARDQPQATTVLVVHDRSDAYIARLADRFPTMSFRTCGKHLDVPVELMRLKPRIVFSFKEAGMSSSLMQPILDCDSVEWLHLATIGTDHLPPLDGCGAVVSNSAGAGYPAMAEYVIGTVLSVNLLLPEYRQQQRERIWRVRPWMPLRGRTILLIGVGWIGKEVARLAKALDMHVIGIKKSVETVPFADEIRSIDRLHESLNEADFVSLQLPLTSTTRQIIDSAALAAMKRSAWLINVGRGGLIDEAALVAALARKSIGGAVLDVFDQEPLASNSPLWSFSNCVVTPHSSGWTENWEEIAYEGFAENLERWLAGESPLSVVPKSETS